MAIIIKSKNMYSTNNPKVRDNVIDTLTVEEKIIKPKNDYETPIYNGNFSSFVKNTRKYDYDFQTDVTDTTRIWGGSKSYVELQTTYLQDYEISINEKKDNSYINKIFDGQNINGANNIKCTIFYNLKKYFVTVDDVTENYLGEGLLWGYKETLNEETSGNIEKMPEPTIKASSSQTVNPYASSYAEIKEENLTNLSTLKIDKVGENFYLTLNILVGLETLSLSGVKGQGGSEEDVSVIPCMGEKVVYKPQRVEVTLYGDTMGIELSDGSSSYIEDEYGDIIVGKKSKPYALSGNELLQNGLTLSKNVLSQYKNGKETATIRCSISDYYDEKNNKVIDINSNNMSFRLHDEVIPYIYGSNGEDKPMSKYKNGEPKIFEVVGTNIIYDGAVWQELTLIEKTIDN